MILSIPTKAKEEFIRLCHVVAESEGAFEFTINRVKAEIYSQAIKDICGSDVWYSIIAEADQSFPEGVDTCAGIPLFRKNEPV